jgi:hypothetical protein
MPYGSGVDSIQEWSFRCTFSINSPNVLHCSETMLTGESQFHISTPLGIELRSLMTGSMIWAAPQRPTMSVVKPEGGPAASMKPGQKSCVRSSGIITLLAQQPSDGSGGSPPQTRPQ